eukprot:408624_1
MKSTISFISLFLIAHLQSSSRLLHAVCPTGQCEDPTGNCANAVHCTIDPCTRNNGGCDKGQMCTSNYCGGCHAVCSCPQNQCVDPVTHQCKGVVNCFVDPCSINNGGCASDLVCNSNYCGGCNAVCEGSKCGSIGIDCPALMCPCYLCPDGVTAYGCSCGQDCSMEDDGTGNLICSGIIPRDRVCPICGGFDNCVAYNDGCNDCTCYEDGKESCTEMACKTLLTPKCMQCEFEYKLDCNGECVAKTLCNKQSDCTQRDGFHCREDPMCGSDPDYDALCTDPPNVCVDIKRRCTLDEDCDEGFACDGVNRQGNKLCIKYE